VRIIYLSGAVRPELPAHGIGYMLTPMMGNRPDLTGIPFGVDTGCFAQPQAYSDGWYLDYLAALAPYRKGCLFATAPDVVGDAAATLERSAPVLPKVRAAGYPAALVGQDGLERLPVPWDAFDCLFVGGTDAWKLSEGAYALVAEARARGKWAHMGRVNSLRRLRAAELAGYDSADGTFLKYGPAKNLPRVQGWFRALQERPSLPLW
jgi:hypothetical protein